LLYAIVFAVEELRNFRAMAEREPSVGIDEWESTEQLCNEAWRLSSHLWFPGQEPHDYDRFHEANRRAFRERRSGGGAIESLAELPAEQIGYYVNPLDRLVKLHSSVVERITGLTYKSPWHRGGAQLR
jgi:hypothetical protein